MPFSLQARQNREIQGHQYRYYGISIENLQSDHQDTKPPTYAAFLPRDAMLNAVYAIVVCPSICLSVCVSVTLRYCIKTAKRRITQKNVAR